MTGLTRYSLVQIFRRMACESVRCSARLLTLAAVLFLFTQPCFAREVVTLTGDPWPPYIEGALGEEATHGTVVELVREVFRRLQDVELRLPLIPWNRALREVEHGTKDGIYALLKTAERERYMVYTEPLFFSSSLVWYTKNRFPQGFNWNSIEELTRYKVGVTQGYSYGDEFDSAIQSGDLPVVQVSTVEHLFAMLSKERIDLAFANDSVGYALASQSGPEAEIIAAEKATGTEVHYIAFSKKSDAKKLIPQINRILSDLRGEGFIDQVFLRNKRNGAP